VEARKYLKMGSSGLLAMRGRMFRSWGKQPGFTYFGGNADLHGYDYLQFAGQNADYGNVQLRFPLIEAMATPIGVLGGIRGMFFFDIGGAWWDNSGYKFWTTASQTYTPQIGTDIDPGTGLGIPVYGEPVGITGFRLVDGRASYGLGFETSALGFPVHFDWAWRTLFNKNWEDLLFAASGGSTAFRKARFQFWIGYDF